jgi:hypothetical protein
MPFDLVVDTRDPKNGRVLKSSHYTRYSSSDGVVYLREGVYYTESGVVASEDLVRRVVGREAKLEGIKLETTANTLKK